MNTWEVMSGLLVIGRFFLIIHCGGDSTLVIPAVNNVFFVRQYIIANNSLVNNIITVS